MESLACGSFARAKIHRMYWLWILRTPVQDRPGRDGNERSGSHPRQERHFRSRHWPLPAVARISKWLTRPSSGGISICHRLTAELRPNPSIERTSNVRLYQPPAPVPPGANTLRLSTFAPLITTGKAACGRPAERQPASRTRLCPLGRCERTQWRIL